MICNQTKQKILVLLKVQNIVLSDLDIRRQTSETLSVVDNDYQSNAEINIVMSVICEWC